MKRLIIYLLLAIVSASSLKAQQADTLFPYPVPPDNLTTLTERCNYLVYNFWDRCNHKQAFSTLSRLDDAFGTWASFLPYASADTVHLAIDNYLKAVEKQAPKNLVDVGEMAQKWFYCDSAEYLSDEVYLPFCRALANGKKVPNAQKAKYQAQLRILESSSVGMRVPNFTYTAADGSSHDFNEVLASRVVLFFNDPDCLDCRLLKTRLAADYNTNQLIEQGLIKIVSIYPGEADDTWRTEAAAYPDNWIVGACPNIDEYFDLRITPQLYWLDGRHKVIGKDVDIDGLLYLIRQINNK